MRFNAYCYIFVVLFTKILLTILHLSLPGAISKILNYFNIGSIDIVSLCLLRRIENCVILALAIKILLTFIKLLSPGSSYFWFFLLYFFRIYFYNLIWCLYMKNTSFYIMEVIFCMILWSCKKSSLYVNALIMLQKMGLSKRDYLL
jgi:hypothetical protein